MAVTTKDLPVSRDKVWPLLADGRRYADWVVGASHVRDVESTWPAAGSQFHHTVGIWPLHLRDTTAVKECEVGQRLVLEARALPFGRARVEIVLEDILAGTRMVMSEEVCSPSIARWSNPLLAPLIHVRNMESLRRLADLCVKVSAANDVQPATQGRKPQDDAGLSASALDEKFTDSSPTNDPPSSWGGTT
jgi:hypothetical protein